MRTKDRKDRNRIRIRVGTPQLWRDEEFELLIEVITPYADFLNAPVARYNDDIIGSAHEERRKIWREIYDAYNAAAASKGYKQREDTKIKKAVQNMRYRTKCYIEAKEGSKIRAKPPYEWMIKMAEFMGDRDSLSNLGVSMYIKREVRSLSEDPIVNGNGSGSAAAAEWGKVESRLQLDTESSRPTKRRPSEPKAKKRKRPDRDRERSKSTAEKHHHSCHKSRKEARHKATMKALKLQADVFRLQKRKLRIEISQLVGGTSSQMNGHVNVAPVMTRPVPVTDLNLSQSSSSSSSSGSDSDSEADSLSQDDTTDSDD